MTAARAGRRPRRGVPLRLARARRALPARAARAGGVDHRQRPGARSSSSARARWSPAASSTTTSRSTRPACPRPRSPPSSSPASASLVLKYARDAYRAVGRRGIRARRLPHRRRRADLPVRDQHDPGLHADQPLPDAARRGRPRLRRTSASEIVELALERHADGRSPRADARGPATGAARDDAGEPRPMSDSRSLARRTAAAAQPRSRRIRRARPGCSRRSARAPRWSCSSRRSASTASAHRRRSRSGRSRSRPPSKAPRRRPRRRRATRPRRVEAQPVPARHRGARGDPRGAAARDRRRG